MANETIELDYSNGYVSVNVDGIRSRWRDLLTGVEVVTGNGNDHVFVYDTAPGIPTSIDSNGGDDVVTIGKDESVRGIAGPVSVFSTSTLIIDDADDRGTRSATISDTSITDLAPAIINYNNILTKELDIYGEAAAGIPSPSPTPPHLAPPGSSPASAALSIRSTCGARRGPSASTARRKDPGSAATLLQSMSATTAA